MISAPFRASSNAAAKPMPLLAPVMSTLRPAWEGMFPNVQIFFMQTVFVVWYPLAIRHFFCVYLPLGNQWKKPTNLRYRVGTKLPVFATP
jgi:hypothetical protein